MKLKVLLISVALMLSFSLGAFAQSKVSIMFNGKLINTQAKIIDGTTYVPLRAIGEMFGARIGWEPSTYKVLITSDGSDPHQKDTAITKPQAEPKKEEVNNVPERVKLGETVTKNGISIKIKDVEYGDEGEWKTIKVYFDVDNNSENITLRRAGRLDFKLTESKYENEFNGKGYSINHDKTGYIYSGESSSGNYEYYFERDVDIKEITYYLESEDFNLSREPFATWVIN